MRVIDLVSEKSGGQKIDCYSSEKDRLIVGLCPWIWNVYSCAGQEASGRPSRRCWKIVDVGHDCVVVGSDSGELPVVDLSTNKVVGWIPVNKHQRAAVLTWDEKARRLFTHSCPTDPASGDGAKLYTIELQRN